MLEFLRLVEIGEVSLNQPITQPTRSRASACLAIAAAARDDATSAAWAARLASARACRAKAAAHSLPGQALLVAAADVRQAAAVPWATSGSPAVDPRRRATLQPLLDDFQAAFGSMFHGLTGAACDAIYRPVRQPPYPIDGYACPREWWVALLYGWHVHGSLDCRRATLGGWQVRADRGPRTICGGPSGHGAKHLVRRLQ